MSKYQLCKSKLHRPLEKWNLNFHFRYLQNFTEKGIQILGSDVRIERSESHWTIHGTLTVVEDIAKESPIPEDQEEIQTVDEHH